MSMVEKIARAIMMARDNGGCEVVDWATEERDNPHVAQALRQARAALEALRVPSDEMVEGMCSEWHADQGTSFLSDLMRRSYDKAITAALGETE